MDRLRRSSGLEQSGSQRNDRLPWAAQPADRRKHHAPRHRPAPLAQGKQNSAYGLPQQSLAGGCLERTPAGPFLWLCVGKMRRQGRQETPRSPRKEGDRMKTVRPLADQTDRLDISFFRSRCITIPVQPSTASSLSSLAFLGALGVAFPPAFFRDQPTLPHVEKYFSTIDPRITHPFSNENLRLRPSKSLDRDTRPDFPRRDRFKSPQNGLKSSVNCT